jgi:hypothetical protein
LEKLNEHLERQILNTQSLKCGAGFNFYSGGHMSGFGARAAAGGTPGDSYVLYERMNALDEDSVNLLLDYAEVRPYNF